MPEQSLLERVEDMLQRLEVGDVPCGDVVDLLAAFKADLKDADARRDAEREEALKAQTERAFASLTYSEEEMLVVALKEMPAQGGLFVASRVADAAGLTRSVLVNAFGKLESGGLIRTQSQGMKGTRITFELGLTAPVLLKALLQRRRPAA